jgi:hypothetical protein
MDKELKQSYQDNIEQLRSEIEMTKNELDFDPSEFFPDKNNVDLNLDVKIHDYEKDIELIRDESKETLECLANLYLEEKSMKNKNVNNIIKNDALALSDLKFSISCSKRGLINLMKQIDNGVVDADLYGSVTQFQKEMKDGVKMLYDIQKNMKDFYKELSSEIKGAEVMEGTQLPQGQQGNLRIADKDINKMIDKIKEDNKEEQKEKDE